MTGEEDRRTFLQKLIAITGGAVSFSLGAGAPGTPPTPDLPSTPCWTGCSGATCSAYIPRFGGE